MRHLLEAECEAIRASLSSSTPERGGAGAGAGAYSPGDADMSGGGGSGKKRARVPHNIASAEGGLFGSLLRRGSQGLQEDAAAGGARDADTFGRERLSNVADAVSAVSVLAVLGLLHPPSCVAPLPAQDACQPCSLLQMAGRELDPSRILGPQRHGEWFRQAATQGESWRAPVHGRR